MKDRPMKKEYDFSGCERGRFYRPNARMHLPVYLTTENREFVEAIAVRKKADATSVVNELLSNDRSLAKVLG
jgi:hypothetical protein